jgi:hypothetical protein
VFCLSFQSCADFPSQSCAVFPSQSCAVFPSQSFAVFSSQSCAVFPSRQSPLQLRSAPPSPPQYDRDGSREGMGDILTAMTVHPSHSRPAASPAMSTHLFGVYRQCVERDVWARIQLESRGGVEEVTFSCSETTVFPQRRQRSAHLMQGGNSTTERGERLS